jgi:glycosyltransferase involved in cell wall biosynthesis
VTIVFPRKDVEMKFLLFGTGDYYERYKKWFDKGDVVALLDNSATKQNTLIDGIKVLAPQDGIKLKFDYIVILSFYVKAMRQQLEELGVSENKIYHFYDLHNLIYKKEIKKPVEYYGDIGEKKILLLSQDMTLGGPGIALFHAAEVLAKHGYPVAFASMLDGALRERLSEAGIPVIVDVNLQIETMNEAEWVDGYSLIICNTINFHVFLSARNTDIPVIWWLHDSSFFYDGINKDLLRNMNWKNMRIYSVGPVPRSAMQGIVGDIPIRDLLYGVSDTAQSEKQLYCNKEHDNKMCFVTIGYVQETKGQDVLLGAIKKLPDEIRRNCTFYLVGQNSSVMAQKLKAENIPEIVMTGTVDRKKINEILNKADVMVVPSREDSMPTVAAEAMMHSVPCIVSDATGTANYISDGEDGVIFQSEDEDELASKIMWCMEHKDKLAKMGEKARKIYEQHFSMRVFEKNLLEIVKGNTNL